MKEFMTLKPFFQDNKLSYAIGATWLVITDLLQLVIPKLLGIITDSIEKSASPKVLFKYALLILIIALATAFSRYFWRIYVLGTARRLEYFLRNKLFSHLQTLDPKFYDNHKTGDLMALATNDIGAIRMTFAGGLIMTVDALFITVFAVIIMLTTINVKLTLIALLPMPLIALIVTRFNRVVHNRFKKVQKAFASLTDMMHENVSAVRVIKTFVQEKNQVKKFNSYSQKVVDTNLHLVRVTGIFYPLVQYLSALSLLIVLGYGSVLVIIGEISLGDFISFNGYLAMLTWPMMAMGWVINIVQRGAASMSRINDILNEKPEIYEYPEADQNIKELKGKIEFCNLNFSYDHKNLVLKNFSLTINPGETVAILGRTGSGKSTIVDVILRLYDVGRGELFIDDREIHEIPLKTLRKNIGYVPQDSFLFSTTIEENIALADNYVSREKIIAAAKVAGIYEEIVDMPDGFETVVGERGITLSGGQKQRIAIARAVIKDPPILILDDSLSAVDTNTEEKILKELARIRKNRTTIIISNRISTIKDADKIVVLEGGQIVQEGIHQELLDNKKGQYYRLYQKQLLEDENSA
ncbi:MAG: ATP-binding cassette, subfamily multidrug efflux pump [Clostridia bacterium]|jgi:ATP-binding cassette subfamily B protein|nr:multidrug transporter ATP-binding protein [Clostridiales bacterium]MDK2985799.1 ATP-binding cassette, subfamily multidrug efflux pump [Clostridia bacterium]